MKVKVEFSGGLELLFNKCKTMDIEIVSLNDGAVYVKDIIEHLKGQITSKLEFFIGKDNSIRPGIIVLINDSDWEIFEKEDTAISDGDTISFISTLHGG